MNVEFIKAIALRFARVFVSAGIAQVSVILATNPLTDFTPQVLKAWLLLLITSFISGGLAALDKAIRYE